LLPAKVSSFFLKFFSPFQFFLMNNMFAQMGLPTMLTAVFVLLGVLFGSVEMSAQTLLADPNAGSIKTTAAWKDSGSAMQSLQSEIEYLNQLLDTNPGNYAATKMKLSIYIDIAGRIEKQDPVAVAASAAFYQVAPIAGTDMPTFPGINQSGWNTIFNDIVALLTL